MLPYFTLQNQRTTVSKAATTLVPSSNWAKSTTEKLTSSLTSSYTDRCTSASRPAQGLRMNRIKMASARPAPTEQQTSVRERSTRETQKL